MLSQAQSGSRLHWTQWTRSDLRRRCFSASSWPSTFWLSRAHARWVWQPPRLFWWRHPQASAFPRAPLLSPLLGLWQTGDTTLTRPTLLHAGARRGLLIRGGDALERLANVDTVVLDKTGTLTLGKLRLAGLQSFGDCSDADILAAAAAVERTTRHPLAAAIIAAAEEAGVHACLDFVPADACIDKTPTTNSMMC